MPPARSGSGPRQPSPIEQLAAQPDALRWAEQCGWVAGAGYCRNRGCARDCALHADLEADRRRVLRQRRLRRQRRHPSTR